MEDKEIKMNCDGTDMWGPGLRKDDGEKVRGKTGLYIAPNGRMSFYGT